jgi:hypothetical protein
MGSTPFYTGLRSSCTISTFILRHIFDVESHDLGLQCSPVVHLLGASKGLRTASGAVRYTNAEVSSDSDQPANFLMPDSSDGDCARSRTNSFCLFHGHRCAESLIRSILAEKPGLSTRGGGYREPPPSRRLVSRRCSPRPRWIRMCASEKLKSVQVLLWREA